MKHYAAGKRRRNAKRFALVLLGVLFIFLISAVFVVRRNYTQNLTSVSSSQKALLVTIPTGETIPEIGKKLHEQGVIRATWAFEWYVRTHNLGNSLKAGTYSLRPSQSVQEIVTILTEGKVDTALVTILPGKRIDQIRDSLINKYQFSAEEVDAALDPANYSYESALADKPSAANLEGYLYPESFEKTATTKPETIISAALSEMRKHLTPETRTAIIKQGLTVHEGIILASIIEREVSRPEDKSKVAQIFLKRLRSNIALESDATTSYGAILDGAEPNTSYNSPYNTYKNKGLPPGPISNVSSSSIQAVANPANTDFLYFVSGDDDENGVSITYFSKTLEEHEANVAAHCRKKCGR